MTEEQIRKQRRAMWLAAAASATYPLGRFIAERDPLLRPIFLPAYEVVGIVMMVMIGLLFAVGILGWLADRAIGQAEED
jgi:hypothetical protein